MSSTNLAELFEELDRLREREDEIIEEIRRLTIKENREPEERDNEPIVVEAIAPEELPVVEVVEEERVPRVGDLVSFRRTRTTLGGKGRVIGVTGAGVNGFLQIRRTNGLFQGAEVRRKSHTVTILDEDEDE